VVDKLTDMQKACIRCCFEGMSNAEIGGRLGVTEGTVKKHLTHAYDTLGAARFGSPRTAAAIMLLSHDMSTHAGRLLRTEER
jgi:DNA-binding NarL/FixJ family response regulator